MTFDAAKFPSIIIDTHTVDLHSIACLSLNDLKRAAILTVFLKLLTFAKSGMSCLLTPTFYKNIKHEQTCYFTK